MTKPNVTKAVILAGGKGTRLAEETVSKPKPMVEIGGKPILWHIMKMYAHHGIKDFVICLGYKGHMIKEYFMNYALLNSDITVNGKGEVTIHNRYSEDWSITLADTGEETMTGGRLKRIKQYLNPADHFCMTYGDGVSDVNIRALIEFHQAHGKLATVTGTYPTARFGALELDGHEVKAFQEKPRNEGGYINGGFFVLSPKVLDLIAADETLWEKEPLEKLSQSGELQAFFHDGFWQPMDTLRDKHHLEELWEAGKAPWKQWDNTPAVKRNAA